MAKDNLQKKSIALPAAGSTANTASLDLGSATPGPLRALRVIVSVPATPSLANTKTITLTVAHSADNSTFTTFATAGTITGPASGGGSADEFEVTLPREVLRYIRASAAVEASGGDNTGVSFTLQLAA